MKSLIYLICLLLTPLISFADEPISHTNISPDLQPLSAPMPENCGQDGVIFQNGQLILGITGNLMAEQPIYLIRNNSDYPQLSLNRATEHPLSASWISRLDEGKWSAITLSHPGLVINCLGRKPGAIGFVDCASVLLVCSYPRGKISSGGGSYWLAENRPLFDVLAILQNHGATVSSP